VRERLAARGLEGTVRLAFEEPAPEQAEMVGRSHPLPVTLAEAVLESALEPGSSTIPAIGRTGAWSTKAVAMLTTVALLRFRFKLTVHGRQERLLLAEEAGALAWHASSADAALTGEEARALLAVEASGNLAASARQRLVAQARERVSTVFADSIAGHARERAEALAADHARLRAAASGISRVSVEPVLPADIIGLYVLVPHLG
jgi:hypothetical protein